MSSRALRRMQRERDTELCSVSQCPKVEGDEETPDSAESVNDRDSITHKPSSGPANLFDLVVTVSCIFTDIFDRYD